MKMVFLLSLYVFGLNTYVLPRYVLPFEGYHVSTLSYAFYALQPGNPRGYRCSTVVAVTESAVATGITNASNGDHLCIAAGAATYTNFHEVGSVSSRTKMLFIHGAGAGTSSLTNTIITANNTTNEPSGFFTCCPIFVLYPSHTLGHGQISGIRFTQGANWANGSTAGCPDCSEEAVWAIVIGGHCDVDACNWRIDHNHFEQNTNNDHCCDGNIVNSLRVGGLGVRDATLEATRILNYGVIDHNYFHGHRSFQCVDVLPDGGVNEGNVAGNVAWQTDLSAHQGTSANVFFESNIVYGDIWGDNNACLDGDAGAAIVARHNTFYNQFNGGHGYEGDRSIKWLDVYSNLYILDDLGTGYTAGNSLRGGTGVYHDNRFCDGSHKCGLSFSGTRNWQNFFELQYYRAYADTDFRGPKDTGLGIDCQGSNSSIPEAANTALTLGCDNFDHVSPASDAGWLAGDQPGAKKGSSQPTWVWGYRWAQEPVTYWANYLGSGTSIPATAAAFDSPSAVYIQARRDFISDDGTAADCSPNMGESICSTWWDDTNHKKVGYTAFTDPHPLTVP